MSSSHRFGDLGARLKEQWGTRLGPARTALALAALLVVGLSVVAVAPVGGLAGAFVAGRPSPSDIIAPRTIVFTSQLRTEAQRAAAERAVPTVYASRDRSVADDQRRRATQVLRHIAMVRANEHAAPDERRTELGTIPELVGLSAAQLDLLLAAKPAAFDMAAAEVLKVVALNLREDVRPEDVPVPPASLLRLVSTELDDATAEVVAKIASAFVVPNTRVDEERTADARAEARASVPPELVSLAVGQTIVREGDPLTPSHLEAMERLGLLGARHDWRETAALLALMLALVAVAAGWVHTLRPAVWLRSRPLALAVALIVAFAFGARIVVPAHVVLGSAYPAAAVGMTLTVLVGLETGTAAALVLAVAVGVVTGSGFESTAYILLGSIAGSVVLARIERFSAFLAAAAAVALTNLAVIVALRWPQSPADLQAFLELAAAAGVNAALSTSLAAFGSLAAGTLFGITTSIQLLEIARPDHPLLRQLQVRAPGTYHHSILIANLAEAAADAIGGDVLLMRVAAYYHDVGKSLRPYFFIENQMVGQNPHDGLDPYDSARIVISHVADGADLAAGHGLPRAVIDAIWQHHGTSRVEYFYRQAVDRHGEGEVDEAAFRYPGPRPRSREMAILMLADAAEASVRASSMQSPPDVDGVLERIFQHRLGSGQLDDSDLTLRDLQRVRQAFVAVFRRMYHPRIQYPAGIEPAPARPGGEG